MVEDTQLVSVTKLPDGREEEEVVETLAQVDKGENVRAAGSDVVAGEKVLEKGDLVSSAGGEMGTLAFVGRKQVGIRGLSLLRLTVVDCEMYSGTSLQKADRSHYEHRQ